MSIALPTRPSDSDQRTHVVLNQPPPLEGYNAYLENRPLVESVRREGADWAEERLEAAGWRVIRCTWRHAESVSRAVWKALLDE